MSFVKEVNGEKTIIKIEGAMSIYEAADMRQAWMECLETCESVAIDLSGVTDCDISGVQLLHSARMTADTAQKAFEIIAVSPAITEVLATAGLNTKN